MEKLLSLCVYFTEAIIAWLYFMSLFVKKRKTWSCLLVFAGGYGLAWLLFNFHIIWLNAFFFATVNATIMLICFHCKWKTVLFHAGILTVLSTGSEVAVEFILGILFGGFGKYQSNYMAFTTLFVFSKLLYLGLSRACIRIANPDRKQMPQSGPAVLLFTSFPIATLIMLLVMSHVALTLPIPHNLEILMATGSVVLLFADLLIFIGYRQDQKLVQDNFSLLLTQQREKAEEEHYLELEEQYEHQRLLIHDINKHLSTVRDMAAANADFAIKKYAEDLLKTPALQRKVHFCRDPLLNIVLSRYSEMCSKCEISFFTDVRDISLDFLAPGDLTALFGNLLDNAFEAAENAERPTIELRVDSSSRTKLVLSLTNSCSSIPKTDTAGSFLSQKKEPEKHGLGLKSIRNIVKKYGGTIQTEYEPETKQFHVTILIQ